VDNFVENPALSLAQMNQPLGQAFTGVDREQEICFDFNRLRALLPTGGSGRG
jgi:hypothetical protein